MKAWLVLVPAGAALAVLAIAGARGPDGRILWSADGSRPLHREWASYATATHCWKRDNAFTAPGADSSRARLGPRDGPGRPAYVFRLHDGDDCSGERTELGQGNPSRPGFERRVFRRGDEVWIGYQLLIARETARVSTWQCLGQLKPEGVGGPVLCPTLVDDRLGLERASSTELESVGTETVWRARAPVAKDRWLKLLIHVRFDPDRDAGFVELWADLADGDGLQQRVRKTHDSTMKVGAPNEEPPPVHARIGIYRDREASGPARVYFAGYAVGTTRGIVEEAAFASGGGRDAPDDG